MAEIVDFGLQQHKIKMDSRYFENVLSVVAGDTGRRIEVQLLDTNGMVQDTTGLNLRLNAEIAGKTTFTDATLVDAATGKYQLDLSNGMFLAPGNWQFQWQITDSAGKKLHSFAFTGNIGKNISEGGSQATNFYLNLEDLKAMQDDLVNGTIDSEVLETNIAEKLTNLETQYAPKLTEVTAQLAQTEENMNELSYEDSIKVPTVFSDAFSYQHEKLVLTSFKATKKIRIDRVRFFLNKAHNDILYEAGIYDEGMNLLVASETRQVKVGDVGKWVEVAVPKMELYEGLYYIALVNRHTLGGSYTFEVQTKKNDSYIFDLQTYEQLPSKITTLKEYGFSPLFEIVGDSLDVPEGFAYSESPFRVYGNYGNTLYGWDTTKGKVCMSADSGATFTNLMDIPSALMGGESVHDMIVAESRLYLFTNRGRMLRTSSLSSSATWEDISAPEELKRPYTISRPYGIIYFNGYVFIGEYSSARDGELVGGPRILKYHVATGVWSLSKQFPNARHIHSFYAQGTVALWVSVGDAGYGSDIGIKRLTSINGNDTDTWTQWTSSEYPRTDHYPVDFIVTSDGILQTSDRIGKHLLYTSNVGSVGEFNINALAFQVNADKGETARSLVLDNDKNAYYWTAETSEPALYVSPPPYTQTYKLKTFPNSLFLTKSILSPDGKHIFMFNQKINTVKFPPRKEIVTKPTVVKKNYLYNKGFERVPFTHNGVGLSRKNDETLYLETSSEVGASSKASYYCQLDVTTLKAIYAEYTIGNLEGTTITKISANPSTNADDITKQVQPYGVENQVSVVMLDVSDLSGLKYIHFQAVSSQKAKIQMKINSVWIE